MPIPTSFIDGYLERALFNAQHNDGDATSYAVVKAGMLQSTVAIFFKLLLEFLGTGIQSLLPALALILIAITTHFLPHLAKDQVLGNSPLALAVLGMALLVGLVVSLRTAWLLSRRRRGGPFFLKRASHSLTFLAPPVSHYVSMLSSNLFTLVILVLLTLSFDQPYVGFTGILALTPFVIVVGALLFSPLIDYLLALRGLRSMYPGGYLAQNQQPAEQLDDRIARLQQIRVWLQDDRLREMVDAVIEQQAQAVARRQVIITMSLSIMALVVGWLLAAITPAIIGKLL